MAADSHLQVLVVEDDADTRRALEILLRRSGYSITTAGSVQAARQILETRHFDVLLSDLGLPDGDGWDLLRAIGGHPFAIAMSGFGAQADREKSAAAGFRHHLLKPFRPEELKALLPSPAV